MDYTTGGQRERSHNAERSVEVRASRNRASTSRTLSERPEPSQPRPPVIGTPYMRALEMTCQERRSMEAMARDLHDARSRISYHHHNIAEMSDMVYAVCGYAYSAQRTAIRAMITSAIAGGLALILAVALILGDCVLGLNLNVMFYVLWFIVYVY
ncbi:unnamed protein product [Lactuca virosa]|uniref:Uncharacterized protein n=1 Tax=Lactuca virosa TaxID=75947 RepID=A0AAU9NRK8_9ASTR|nr:unnamed protein product [Lactuca virosa]